MKKVDIFFKEKDFKPLLVDSISKFMTNLEWKANIFLAIWMLFPQRQISIT